MSTGFRLRSRAGAAVAVAVCAVAAAVALTLLLSAGRTGGDGGGGTAAPPPPPTTTHLNVAGPAGLGGRWKLAFDDEFDTGRLDTSKWTSAWGRVSGVSQPVNGSELECYDSSQAAVSGGELHLTVVQRDSDCGGTTRPYTSGIVTTDPEVLGAGRGFQFTHGVVEVRAYVPPGSGQCTNWPAIWTDGRNWPKDGEIDVYECLSGKASWHLVSGSHGAEANAPGAYPPASAYTGWHTFAADWEPGEVTFYYDGVNVGSHSYRPSSPNYVILNNAVGAEGGQASAPADFRVDWVRVWQRP
ncbi:glycoside hydrolase family 16 protein [Phaeacidiphilus oryzae]|uniref:glycoside hydrolase family 16 protein n=1 Tax=Phaeacidiphilus oryzae TaxID=348818 RepID=UPI000559C5D2|nr:glycoside hydrolase family 16 protein [Phaeacidiphilus oryzae]